MAVIGMVVGCLMMVAGAAWAGSGNVTAILGVVNANGTVTDGDLVWLKNANCFGDKNWLDATSAAASLKSGSCGLTDGSHAGQWRLPTKDEMLARQKNTQGFTNVALARAYWSGSTYSGDTTSAWLVKMHTGFAGVSTKTYNFGYYVWPVRSVNGHFTIE